MGMVFCATLIVTSGVQYEFLDKLQELILSSDDK